jgi:cytochrome c2
MRLMFMAGLAFFATSTGALAQDGAALFAGQCKTCHAVAGESGPVGPSLKGVFGRKIAGAGDYSYSAGLKAKGGTWSESTLDAFLAAPSAFAPGTDMMVQVAQPTARASLITFLKTVK